MRLLSLRFSWDTFLDYAKGCKNEKEGFAQDELRLVLMDDVHIQLFIENTLFVLLGIY